MALQAARILTLRRWAWNGVPPTRAGRSRTTRLVPPLPSSTRRAAARGSSLHWAATASGVREVTIGGHPAFAGEERNVDGALIASHIAWDSGNYVVAFTVYETRVDAALKLAKDISSVSKQEWDSAMNAAAAD